jgi:hypothetical protein
VTRQKRNVNKKRANVPDSTSSLLSSTRKRYMSLRNVVLDYIEEHYGDKFISEELEEKINELEQFIDAALDLDEDFDEEEEPLDFLENMDQFNDEE